MTSIDSLLNQVKIRNSIYSLYKNFTKNLTFRTAPCGAIQNSTFQSHHKIAQYHKNIKSWSEKIAVQT